MQPRDAGSSGGPAPDLCLVVGVGASAGGLDAFGRFLRHMPPHPRVAVVYVQHLDPHHESMLPNLLARDADARRGRPRRDARRGRPRLRHSTQHLPVAGRRRAATRRAPARARLAKSIDGFLRSLAVDQGERAVAGIILSGTGTDGTDGLRAIKGTSTSAPPRACRQRAHST